MILHSFVQLFSISRNTFTESIRQPVYVVLLFLATILLILNPNLAAYTFEDDNKLLIDLGLSTLFLFGLLLAAFTATGVLGSEIENKTVLTVISKPIARPVFVIGKFLGVALAIGLGYWTMTALFLLTVRHGVQETAAQGHDGPAIFFGTLAFGTAVLGATAANYFYRWVFTSTFVVALGVLITLAYVIVMHISSAWAFQATSADFKPQLMIGLVMVFQAVLILTAVAIAASTRLGQIMTLIICVGVFLVGLVSEYFLGSVGQAPTQEVMIVAKRIGLADKPADVTYTLQIPGEEGSATGTFNFGEGEDLQTHYVDMEGLIGATSVIDESSVVVAFGKPNVARIVNVRVRSRPTLLYPLYVVTPNLQLLWPADALTQGHAFTGRFFAMISGYTACIIGALLSLAVCLFQTRDVG